MPFVTDEVVTAAKLNLATSFGMNSDTAGTATFTNTSYLDLDALTGGSTTLTPVAVTVTTGTVAVVHMSCQLQHSTVAGRVNLSYRVSGATTTAASDLWAIRFQAASANHVYVLGNTTYQTGMTAGSNTFELQAQTSGATATLLRCWLVVQTVVP